MRPHRSPPPKRQQASGSIFGDCHTSGTGVSQATNVNPGETVNIPKDSQDEDDPLTPLSQEERNESEMDKKEEGNVDTTAEQEGVNGNISEICKGGPGKSVCGKMVKKHEMGVQCDMCELWYHAVCQDIPKKAYWAIDRFQGVVCWLCPDCKPSLGKQSKMVDKLSELDGKASRIENSLGVQEENGRKIAELDHKISGIETLFREHVHLVHRSLKEQEGAAIHQTRLLERTVKEQVNMRATYAEIVQGSVKQAVETVSKQVESAKPASVKSQIQLKEISGAVGDYFEKDKRKRNIVIHNLPEEPRNSAQFERIRNDSDKVEKMCRDVFKVVVKPERVFRVGQSKNGKPRLLIVCLPDEGSKWDILRMAKQLRNIEEYSNIYISPDLTPEEQRQDKVLRDELKRRRDAGEDVEIRRKQVVPRERNTVVQPRQEGNRVEEVSAPSLTSPAASAAPVTSVSNQGEAAAQVTPAQSQTAPPTAQGQRQDGTDTAQTVQDADRQQ